MESAGGPHRRPRLDPIVLLEGLARDLRLAVRQLARRPGFSLFVALTLAVGIGPSVAIFSVLKALVLQPFYYPEPDRLVQVWETDKSERNRQPFSSPDYYDIREQNTTFKELGLYTTSVFNLGDGEPLRVQGVLCTASVLRTYAVEPAMGRWFTEEEEQEGRHRVAVLSNALWKGRYGGDAQIIGRRITLNAEEHDVVGVMPEDFQFSSPWYRGTRFELWTPIRLSREDSARNSHSYLAIGRLKEGVDWRSAEAELQGIAARLAEAHPTTNARTQLWLMPIGFEIMGRFVGQLLILALTVGFVLLVACANVAGLLLARGAGRQTEHAVRISLGAARRHILSHQLAESLLLALLGAMAGVLLASWSIDLLRHQIPPGFPGSEQIAVDRPVLVFSLGVALLSALLFGLAPALTASRAHVVDALKEGGGSRAAARARNRALRFLAVAQVAVALMLTNGAILLFKSYRNVLNVPQSFDTTNVLTAGIWLWGPRYDTDEKKAAFWEQAVEGVRVLPGVEHAAVTSKLPLEGGTNTSILVDGEVYDPEIARPLVERSLVSSDYFNAMGIPFLAGGTLTDPDEAGSENEVVVNRALVDRYWPGETGVGKRIRNNGDPTVWSYTIVGVVEDVRQWTATHHPLPEMYRPFRSAPRVNAHLTVRSAVDPLTLAPAIRQVVAGIDPDMPLSGVRTMEDVLAGATRGRRFLTLLLDLFAVIALTLAVAGIYGVVSYQVAQRTHEMGVRVALGANRRDLLAMIMRHSLLLVVVGLSAGLALTLNAAFVAGGYVYGISPLNPLYLSGGAFLVVLVAMLASGIAALRGSRLDPVQALRAE